MSTYQCEYALSGRARCRKCQVPISKNEIRLGPEKVGDWGVYVEWHHPACFDWSRVRSMGEISGFHRLKAEDQTALQALKSGLASSGADKFSRGWKPLPLTLHVADTMPGASHDATDVAATQNHDSQIIDVEDEPTICYGRTKMLVVGCRYYQGVLHNGEFATLNREPRNQYDADAVRVDNLAGMQVGHLKRTFAAALAPIMDDPSPLKPTIEALVENQNEFAVTINVAIYGPEQFAEQTVSFLRGFGIHLSGGNYEASAGSSAVISRQRSGFMNSQKDLDAMFDELQSQMANLNTGELDEFCGDVIQSTLLPHQREGVAWMLARERACGLPPFWNEVVENGQKVYLNTITKTSYLQPPPPVKGGLLADDMGLGKTLQILSLVVAHPPEGIRYSVKCAMKKENSDTWKRIKSMPSDDIGGDGSVTPARKVSSGGNEELSSQTDFVDLTANEAGEGSAKDFSQIMLGTALKGKDWSKMKVPALRSELDARGIAHAGYNKAGLVRLLEAASSSPTVGTSHPTAKASPKAEATSVQVTCGSSESNGKGTLIVCPTSVLGNWIDQAAEHLAPGAVTMLTFHGSNRDEGSPSKADIVITTYGTLVAEHAAMAGREGDSTASGKRKRNETKGLLGQLWHRVVLDEAHTIRNRKTKTYQACAALKATHRWCVTGTPIQNKADDVQSLFAFLRAEPVCDPSVFTRAIGRPIQEGDAEGLARLRVLMRGVCLRRAKSLLGSALPTRTIEVHRVELMGAHREAYDVLFESVRRIFDAAMASSDSAVLSQYSSVLECLLRLRQVCDALELVPVERLATARQVLQELEELQRTRQAAAGNAKGPPPAITAEEAAKLFQKLKGALMPADNTEGGGQAENAGGSFECAVCLGELEAEMSRVLRRCGHCFCDYCLGRIAAQQHGGKTVCPLCRAPFTTHDILDTHKLESIQSEAVKSKELKETAEGQSAPDGKVGHAATAGEAGSSETTGLLPPRIRPIKIDAMIKQLRQAWASDPSQKAVVFSQFVGMLDVVESDLQAEGISFGRLDGSMSMEERKRVIRAFGRSPSGEDGSRAEDGPSILLVSLKAGGQGINLTRANWVFMLDLWWNAGVEEQAMDRVYRIGQTRPVTVVRYVCSNTVEEKILQLQEKKRLLGQGALAKMRENGEAPEVEEVDLCFRMVGS